MQEKIYKSVLYFISAVILITLAIQVYWNFKNYDAGEAMLRQDVKQSLEKAVSLYYAAEADKNTVAFAVDDYTDSAAFDLLDSINIWIEFTDDGVFLDSTKRKLLKGITEYRGSETLKIPEPRRAPSLDSTEMRKDIKFSPEDSLKMYPQEDDRAPEAFFYMTTDSVNMNTMDSLIFAELNEQKLPDQFGLRYTDLSEKTYTLRENIFEEAGMKIVSQSRYLEDTTRLELGVIDQGKILFERVMLGIALSILLIGAVIASLLYLLRIIRNQKQIAEIKNDFISNITHEFKTPIATISVALEGIQHFNNEKDSTKTEKYIEMSNDQLAKLNTMVERILDMATLDKEELRVVKIPVNLVPLIKKIISRHQTLKPEAQIILKNNSEEIMTPIDIFHFENAIDNLVDNGLKYGEAPITITLSQEKNSTTLTLEDKGESLSREQAERIFEKFYRVPKGNTHDVKGFGIGLFYTKTIIEKHGGSISVSPKPNTTFKISIPNV